MKDDKLKDRGLVKWAPFKSVPWDGYKKIYEDDRKIKRPTLDEDELEIINYRLTESLESNSTLIFSLYKDGFIINKTGIVSKIDSYQRKIHIKDVDGYVAFLRFEDIVGVENV